MRFSQKLLKSLPPDFRLYTVEMQQIRFRLGLRRTPRSTSWGRDWLPSTQEPHPRFRPIWPLYSALRASILRPLGYNDPPDLRMLEETLMHFNKFRQF